MQVTMVTLIIINASILILLAMLHIFWAIGGKVGSGAAVPTRSDGRPLFSPGPASTLVVACGLILFALITLGNLPAHHGIDRTIIRGGTWTIVVIFILRALGDFRFIGFFKTERQSLFARNDTRIYSPLSLVIGMISLIIAAQFDT